MNILKYYLYPFLDHFVAKHRFLLHLMSFEVVLHIFYSIYYNILYNYTNLQVEAYINIQTDMNNSSNLFSTGFFTIKLIVPRYIVCFLLNTFLS